MPVLNRVKVYRNADGSIVQVSYIREAMKLGETEDDFIQRTTQTVERLYPGLKNLQSFLKSRSEIVSLTGLKKEDKRRIRMSPAGTLSLDSSIEIPKEKIQRMRNSIKLKLNNLTNEELEFLLGK